MLTIRIRCCDLGRNEDDAGSGIALSCQRVMSPDGDNRYR